MATAPNPVWSTWVVRVEAVGGVELVFQIDWLGTVPSDTIPNQLTGTDNYALARD